jgi:hypothetical protein
MNIYTTRLPDCTAQLTWSTTDRDKAVADFQKVAEDRPCILTSIDRKFGLTVVARSIKREARA